jgi:hypothetical protein
VVVTSWVVTVTIWFKLIKSTNLYNLIFNITTRSSLVSDEFFEENSFLANIIRYRETIPRKQSMLVFPKVQVFLCTLPRKFSRKNLCQWSTFFYVSYRGKIPRKQFVTAVIIKCLLTLSCVSHFSVPATHKLHTQKELLILHAKDFEVLNESIWLWSCECLELPNTLGIIGILGKQHN